MPSVRIVHNSSLFSAPPNSILIHACNTVGSWRSGVAAAFKAHYPGAHSAYVSACSSGVSVGSTLLIPPQACDVAAGRQHWIACLFTSARYGKDVDAPETVLKNTRGAMEDLLWQVEALEIADGGDGVEKDGGGRPGEWHAAKINSVRFRVPWEETVGVVEEVLEGKGREVVVYEYDEVAAADAGRGGRGKGRGRA
ncbi:hypothetical protein FN846DRAFT_916673 [Sphaerosporella brunnea]|uniref:ADP-ribose 1''-phosphate phosphatase n=1 Tax=Sphaerosporella brunnea TaxID=1250544 RepID=A0A5J5F7G6_9PEZI|nr:hypothetical protein FN846DRAFT_916673 [Sphaerosporella brunnea]